VIPMLEIVNAAVPVFTNVIAAGLLLVPTSCGAKFCRAGEIVRKGPLTPVPVRGIANGLIRVLSVKFIAPD